MYNLGLQIENGSEKPTNSGGVDQVSFVQTKVSDGRYWSVREKVLLALVVVFLTGFIVFAILYATASKGNTVDSFLVLFSFCSLFHTYCDTELTF